MSETTNIWADDLLDRKKDADFLYTYLLGRNEQKLAENKDSFVLNIDAEWGMGKTFFLDHFKEYLEAKNHLVISINAWEDDNASDPFISILAGFDTVFKPFLKKPNFRTKWDSAKKNAGKIALRAGAGLIKTAANKYLGNTEELLADMDEPVKDMAAETIKHVAENLEKLVDKQTQNLIDKFNEQKDDEKKFRDNLKTVIRLISETDNDTHLPIFVLIDELDRCRPSYAIALLERVKHLFNVPNLVFVFATNSNQLQHAVAGAYGANFDGFNYLNRFFDRRYSLTITDRKKFIEAGLPSEYRDRLFPNDQVINRLNLITNQFNIELRELPKLFDLIITTLAITPKTIYLDINSLTILAIQYLKTGNCDWSVNSDDIPDDMFIEKIYHNNMANSINIKSLFQDFKNIILSKDNSLINQFNNTRTDDVPVNIYYIGRLLNASEQMSFININQMIKFYRNLPDMIKSAGKFANDQ